MDTLTTTERKAVTPYVESARRYAAKSKAANTKRAYRTAWANFTGWCEQHDLSPLPADVGTVINYLTHLADTGYKVATIEVYRAAIASAHTTAGHPDPTGHNDVSILMSGIRRVLAEEGRALPAKKEPVTLEDLRALVASIDTGTIAGKRDRAIILVGYAGAFRRSELVALDVEHLRLNGKIIVTLPTSKTDQEGEGHKKHIPQLPDNDLCPVAALTAYLDAAGIASGPVFRRLDRGGNVANTRLSAQSVALILKKRAKAAGLDWRSLSGHSLRAGFVTTAHTEEADNSDIMAQTGHKSANTLRPYIRDAGLGAERAALAAFGLQRANSE